MHDTPPRPLTDVGLNPSELAILHDRATDTIETWTGEDDTELPDGAVPGGLRIRRLGQCARRLKAGGRPGRSAAGQVS
jgi:hypothetical protein